MRSRANIIPAYYRLAEDLRNQIESGELKPGDMIPSTAQMARQYEISHMTVRQGLALLSKDGYIESIQGKGSFVTAPSMDNLVLRLSENNIMGEDRSYLVRLMELHTIAADDRIARKLDVDVGSRIIKIKRLLSRSEGPVAIDCRYLPYVKGVPLLEKEIEYATFPELVARHTELASVRNSLRVSASILSEKEAQILDISAGFPALCVEQIIYAPNDRPVGWSKMICRGDRFTLTAVSQPS
jgi:GntR family transcriptional regulator